MEGKKSTGLIKNRPVLIEKKFRTIVWTTGLKPLIQTIGLSGECVLGACFSGPLHVFPDRNVYS